MTVKRINATHYANIYGVYDETGKMIGTVEERLAGRDTGTYCNSISAKYSKRDIRRFFKESRAA